MNNPKTKKNLLVIEDEADILFSLKSYLESEGYEVATAENGKEGLTFLDEHPMPALILLDMKMPVMNGWEFSEAYRRKFSLRAPVIVMTAAADAEARAREAQANGWLGKPFSLDEINSQLQKFLGAQ
ncbi:MAG: response regulator [Proteobacteria bacterium]|nr:response regulator [Pseudomonadota bacterium]